MPAVSESKISTLVNSLISSRIVHRLLRHAHFRLRRISSFCLIIALPCIVFLLEPVPFVQSPTPRVVYSPAELLTMMRVLWRQPVPLSPLLEQVVNASQHLTASHRSFSSSAHNCPGHPVTNASRKSPADHVFFQKMVPNRDAVYLFSAYFDQRWRPTPTVVIIGLSLSERYLHSKTYCQIWYRDDVTGEPHVTRAQVRESSETHGRRYTASLFTCHVRNNDVIPYAVSLVRNPCDPAPVNRIKVMTSPGNDDVTTANFTVCVSPLNFAYDDVKQLVETIEVNWMFGARQFIFYNHTSGPNVKIYLDFYRKWLNAVSVIPWPLPMATDVLPHDPKITPEVHYFAQGAALTDCLFRSMIVNRSPFVVFTDLDEIIVPRRQDTWSAMLDNVTSAWLSGRSPAQAPFPGSYNVRNTFFRTDWTRDRKFVDRGPKFQDLKTLTVTEREVKVFDHYYRSKYIALSSATYQPGVHDIENTLPSSHTVMVEVDPRDALVHHYRLLEDDPIDPPSRTVDRYMHRYASVIAHRTSAVHDLVTSIGTDGSPRKGLNSDEDNVKSNKN